MFRYIALAWDDTVPQQAAMANGCSSRLQARAAWSTVLRRPGLHVHLRDSRRGTNADYPLGNEQGLIVGRLFRRQRHGEPALNTALTSDEETEILHSGGQSLVRDFWGRYIAFLPGPAATVRVLRDPTGTLPCFLSRHDGVWIIYSWLEDLLTDLPEVPGPNRVNWDAVTAHLLLGEPGGRETTLQDVSQVLPGEAVQLALDAPRSELLWDAVGIATRTSDIAPEVAAERLRDTVRACARSWAGCYDGILFRLSGGVDSSILLSCLAADGTPARVTCVNYHSIGSDSDERTYARLAAARACRRLIERERDAGFRVDRLLTSARTPTPGSYLGRMNARADAELAAACGAPGLFTGAGGDQLFFEFDYWWPVADYLRQRGLDRGFLPAAMSAARLGRVSLWKACASAVRERFRPRPPFDDLPRSLPLLGPAAQLDEGQRHRFMHPALQHIADLPIGKAMQTLSLQYPIPYYDPFEVDAAPEIVNPLLSQPLVELCLQLPTWILTCGGRGRGLARRAFAADLPPEVAARRSKGGMEEHVKSVLQQNVDFIRGLLLDGELVRRGLLDRARVEEILSGRPTALTSHVSRIHVYAGIEAWLQRCHAASRPAAD